MEYDSVKQMFKTPLPNGHGSWSMMVIGCTVLYKGVSGRVRVAPLKKYGLKTAAALIGRNV